MSPNFIRIYIRRSARPSRGSGVHTWVYFFDPYEVWRQSFMGIDARKMGLHYAAHGAICADFFQFKLGLQFLYI